MIVFTMETIEVLIIGSRNMCPRDNIPLIGLVIDETRCDYCVKN